MRGAAPGADLRELDPQMEDLFRCRDERPVFLHPIWLRTWLSEFGANCEPVFLSARDDSPLGVAPLMRLDDRLTFVGDPEICDYMDFLVAPDRSAAAYEELWRRVRAEAWSQLDLWGLMAASPTAGAIADLATADGYAVERELEAVAPRIDLPSSWDEYLASLSKKDRHELRRKMRRLFESGAGVDFDVFSEQKDVVSRMDAFLNLHTGSRQDKTDFMTDGMASFFRRMASALAAEGLVRLFMLSVNGRPAASVFCFDAGNCLYLYNSGYDPEFSSLAVGLVSKALCLQWAIENGKQCLDFLRGNEPYKYDLGARDREIYTLRVRRTQ